MGTFFSSKSSLLRFTIVFLLLGALQLNHSTPHVHNFGRSVELLELNLDYGLQDGLQKETENTRPILGILTQEVSRFISRKYTDRQFTSYIAASYVKFVEGAGGRVIPIWIGKSREYYEDIMTKINGVLFPGGATFFNQSDGYADAGKHIYQIAINMNEHGIYMPIWGTCLGFELLIYLSANGSDPRIYCESSSQASPLNFKKGFRKNRLFASASDEIIDIFQHYPVTINFHMYCITEEHLALYRLNETWKVLSLNKDRNGLEYISTVEHMKYPFYGVQFHPEKNLYEFVRNRNITHTTRSTKTSQYFADFLVNQSRKNMQCFRNRTEEADALIYNYKPEYTGKIGSAFEQQYLFEDRNKSNKLVNCLTPLYLSFGALVAMQRLYDSGIL